MEERHMMILLDTANLEDIKKGIEYYPVSGVTTNPTIIAKEKTNFLDLVKEIRSIIGYESSLHVQTLGMEAKDIVEEALFLNDLLGDNTYVKVPVIPEGIKAMKKLHKEGVKITATAILTPQQALMAAKAGASFLAPYVNRLDNISGNGINVVREIVQLLEIHKLDAKVLAASFRNVEQVHKSSLAGAQSITAPLSIIEDLLYHPLTELSVENFIKDWETVYGQGIKTIDLK